MRHKSDGEEQCWLTGHQAGAGGGVRALRQRAREMKGGRHKVRVDLLMGVGGMI